MRKQKKVNAFAGECGILDYEWPVCTNERERIRFNTETTAGMSIAEAFAHVYKLKLKGVKDTDVNDYKELNVGDVAKLRVLNIDRKGVVFDNGPYKDEIISNVNLFRYSNFRTFIPKEPIECIVVRKERGKIYVDPIAGMYDNWLHGIIDNIRLQYDMTECKPTIVKNGDKISKGEPVINIYDCT